MSFYSQQIHVKLYMSQPKSSTQFVSKSLLHRNLAQKTINRCTLQCINHINNTMLCNDELITKENKPKQDTSKLGCYCVKLDNSGSQSKYIYEVIK